MEELNLYQIMAEDHEIWLKRNERFGFDLEVDNEDGEAVVNEKGVHPGAIEGLASFCRRFLHTYEQINKEAA